MTLRILSVPLLLVVAACASETMPEASSSVRGPVEHRLAGGLALDLDGDASRVHIAGEVSRERAPFERDDLAVRDGEVRLRASAHHTLVLEALRLLVDDITVSPEVLPPNGVSLTDVHVELASPVEGSLTWYEDEGYAEVTVDLNVGWSLVTASGSVALATQTVEDLPIGVTVRTDSRGRLVAELRADAQGGVIDWPTLATIDELSVELTAVESPI